MSWRLAALNLLRDRRRSLVTLASVVIGLGAILVFLSYIRFVEGAMARLVIFQDGNGQVQVWRADAPENLSAFPSRYSLSPDDQRAIAAAIESAAASAAVTVVRHTPQLMGVGMLHHGDKATGFLARGVQPGADAALRGGGFTDGAEDSLPEDEPGALLLTRQAAELIGLQDAGGPVQLSAGTYSGRFNAVEATPAGRFTTGIEALESTGVKVPLRTLQSLYDTPDVSRIVVQLKDRSDSPAFAAALQAALDTTAQSRYAVTRWDSPQVGQLYLSFMGFANTMFLFTGVVLTLIAVAAVQHTISASVNDRLKEIGMLRSFGFARASVTGMFVRESLLLAAVGAVLALLLVHGAVASGALAFDTALPRLSVRVPVALELPLAMSLPVAFVVVACMGLAAWATARRVTRGATARPGPFALARLVAASLACFAVAAVLPFTGDAHAAAPDTQTMGQWLQRADASRGGGAGYSWTSRVHTVDTAETVDTTYAVAVRDGRGLVRVVAPARQAGEKILLDGRAMWYGKKGLRKPVSISPQQRLSGEAANGDIAAVHYARDYTPSFVGESRQDGRDCYELMLTARDGQVTYDAIRYFIDKKTLLGVRADFMTASGVVFKSATFEYANKVRGERGDIPFVSRMRIVNATFPDRFSEIVYSDVSPADHPDNLFRVDGLLAP